MIILRALHICIRAFLVLACAFWLLICLEIIPALLLHGVEGAQGKLVRVWSMGRWDSPWTCQDSIQLLHEGYTDLFIFLLLTWGLVELKRFLSRRIAINSVSAQTS